MTKLTNDNPKSTIKKIAEEYYQLLNEPTENGVTTDELFYRCQRFGFNLDRPTLNRLQVAKVVTPPVNKIGKVNYYSYVSLLELYVFHLVSNYIPGYGNNSKIRDKLLYFSAARDFTMYFLGVDFNSKELSGSNGQYSSLKSFLGANALKGVVGSFTVKDFIRLVNAMDVRLVNALEQSNVTSRINIEDSPFLGRNNRFIDLQSRDLLNLFELKRLTVAYFFFTYIFLCYASNDSKNLQADYTEIEQLYNFYKSFDKNTTTEGGSMESGTSARNSLLAENALFQIKTSAFSENKQSLIDSLENLDEDIPVIRSIIQYLKHQSDDFNVWLEIFYNYTEPFSVFEYIVFSIICKKIKIADNIKEANNFEAYQLRMALELLLTRSCCLYKMYQHPEPSMPSREISRKHSRNDQASQVKLSLNEMLPIVTAYVQGKISKARAAQLLGVPVDDFVLDWHNNDDFPFK